MATNTTNYSWSKPTVGGDEDAWGGFLNGNWDSLDTLLGGVTNTEFEILDGATLTTIELNYMDGVTSNVQTQLNAKGTVSSLSDLSVTATSTELNYVSGVTSAIQTQINTKITADVTGEFIADSYNETYAAVTSTSNATTVTHSATHSQRTPHSHLAIHPRLALATRSALRSSKMPLRLASRSHGPPA